MKIAFSAASDAPELQVLAGTMVWLPYGGRRMWSEGKWDGDVSPYNRLLELSRSGWGWEYARRAPRLRSAAAKARRRHPIITHNHDGVNVTRLRRRCLEAESFGLQFFPNPELSAFETTPFWIPEAMDSNLDADLEARCRDTALLLKDVPGARHYLISPGRRPTLVIAANGYAAQLAIDSNAVAVPQAVFLSLRLGAGQLVGKNFAAVEEFAEFCQGGLPWRPMRGLSPPKLRDAIIALDGTLAGVSRRRIAEAIFGKEVVSEEWDSGDDIYKKRTKRLVEKGLAMMEFGYKNLL